jgi:hypothetical protein
MTARRVAAGEAFVPRFILLPRQGPIGHGEQVATMILVRSPRRYSFISGPVDPELQGSGVDAIRISRSGAFAHQAT